MTRYLLDTNIVSALIRTSEDGPRRRLNALAWPYSVYTSVVVSAEVRFGLSRRAASRLTQQMEIILDEIAIGPFVEPMDRIYADLRAELERRGTPIGANDLWIAAQALHDRSVLVTDNVREFGRVPGLTIENWLRP